MTDVTGFACLDTRLRWRGVRIFVSLFALMICLFLSQAEQFARQGFVTGASGRNWRVTATMSSCLRAFLNGNVNSSQIPRLRAAC